MEPNKKLTRKEKFVNQGGGQQKNKSVSKGNLSASLNLNLGLMAAILAFVLYINTLGNGFVYDDINVITRNHFVKEGMSSIPDLLKTSYRFGYFVGEDELYRPLPMILFATLWQMFPENPLPGHFINILLYALTGFFLFKMLQKLLLKFPVIIPFAATLIFIAHPIHTEVVANIKSVDELMSFLFVIFTFLFLLRYIKNGKTKNGLKAAGFFFLALLSKESAVMMFVIIPLSFYFFRDNFKSQLSKVMLFLSVPLVIYFLMRLNALGTLTGNRHFIFIDNIMAGAPLSTRLATAFSILMYYIRLIFFPHPLSSDYSFRQFDLIGFDDPLAVISIAFHVALLAYAIYGARKKNIFAYGILFYLITIALSSNILVVIGTAFAERFLYVPLLGITLIAAALLSKLFTTAPEDSGKNIRVAEFLRYNRNIFIVVGLLLLPMSYKTIARNADWESDYILFSADAVNSPLSARTHFSYADNIMLEKVMKAADEKERSVWVDKALSEYNKAIEIYPDYADAHGQRGFAHFLKGDKIKAYEDYKKAIELKSYLETTYNNMGYLFSESGEHEKALELYQKSTELNPRFFEAWRNLGSTYYALKKFDKAIEAFLKAQQLSPNDAKINYFLGLTYQQIGDQASAQRYIDKARMIDPGMFK